MYSRHPEENHHHQAMTDLCPSGVRLLPHFTIKQTVYLAMFYVFLLCVYSDKSTASGCPSCYNGGEIQLPNNIFGFCRCKCSGPFMGPKCQFRISKRDRTAAPLPAGFDFKNYIIQRLLGSLNKRDSMAMGNSDMNYGGYYDMEDDF